MDVKMKEKKRVLYRLPLDLQHLICFLPFQDPGKRKKEGHSHLMIVLLEDINMHEWCTIMPTTPNSLGHTPRHKKC